MLRLNVILSGPTLSIAPGSVPVLSFPTSEALYVRIRLLLIAADTIASDIAYAQTPHNAMKLMLHSS